MIVGENGDSIVGTVGELLDGSEPVEDSEVDGVVVSVVSVLEISSTLDSASVLETSSVIDSASVSEASLLGEASDLAGTSDAGAADATSAVALATVDVGVEMAAASGRSVTASLVALRAWSAESFDELPEQAVVANAMPAKATRAIAVLRTLLWRMVFMIFLCSGGRNGCVVFKRRVKGEPHTFLKNS